ncbi:MAG: hemolysin III family protein [Anaerolineales bacterium]|jgi:hemolysin III
MFTKLREPVNGLTHLGGAIAALFGMIALIVISQGQPVKIVSFLVYSFSLIGMFCASAIYHMANVKPVILQTLRKIDHSAIFLLIAGTYTPFCLLAFTGFWHWGLFTLIWVIAISGVVVSVFYLKSPRWLHTGIYVVMGWLCVMAAPKMPAVLPVASMVWLFLGGVIYTIGAVIYATKILDFVPGKFGFHEIWHIFVLLGAIAHFIAVLTLLIRPV